MPAGRRENRDESAIKTPGWCRPALRCSAETCAKSATFSVSGVWPAAIAAAKASGSDEFRGFAEEYRDLGDRVLWLGRLEGRGRGSGVPVSAQLDIIFDVRGDKVSRMRPYLDHDEALRAAGLAE